MNRDSTVELGRHIAPSPAQASTEGLVYDQGGEGGLGCTMAG